MYPYPSYLTLQVLYTERLEQAEEIPQQATPAQPFQQVARSFARTLGHTFLALGTRLEQFAQ